VKRLADRIITFRWLIIIGFVAITAVFAVQIPKSEIDPDMKSQLPKDMESRVTIDRIEDLFGGTEMIMILIRTDDVLRQETLSRVKKIAKQMNRVDGVDKVLSLFDMKSIKGEHGAMIVDPAVKRIPKTASQREELREEIRENDIVYGSVVSKDFTITAVIAVLEADVPDEVMVPRIRQLMEENPGEEEVFLGGLPYTRYEVSSNIRSDLRRLMPLGILIMLVFLYVCFRRFRGVLLPFAVVIMAIIVSMGMIPLLGWKIQIVHVILPVFLIAVANDYGIHLIAKYQEDNVADRCRTNKELAKGIFRSLSRPVVLTGVTTMAGMLCLLGHVIVPARQLGILSALGIVYALAASLFFIPAVISLLSVPKPLVTGSGKQKNHIPLLERLLLFFGDLVSRRPKGVVAASLIFGGISAIGILFVVVDTDPNSYFSEDSPVVHAAELVNENLGGSQNISVVYQGDIKDPRIMHKIDATERALEKTPEVGNTTSIARVVRQMSRALNDPGEPWYDRIPDMRNAVAQYFELYAMSGDAEDFEKLVDFPYEHAVITARLNTTSTAKLKSVVRHVKQMVREDPDVLMVGGFGVVLSDLAQIIVNGQLLSLAMANVIVAVLLMLLFRSVVAGLISAIPLALSMSILFGLMGYFAIELNVATAMLSSIMIGVGVDYTIHFLWRYREERRGGLDAVPAVKRTLTTTGRGIIFNAFSVIIGFVALLVSSFMPVRFFGFLVVVSILACLVGALVLVPSLCLIVRPRFLEPRQLPPERMFCSR
jgi:hydrophobe/amphiphile efflux-3 (HAE3) family protein